MNGPSFPETAPVKILLIWPEFPETFWSFRHALKFIHRKASDPPLGLLTVAALLPSHWQKRLLDMNIEDLRDSDIRWADFVFLSAMAVQKASARKIIAQCRALGRKVVAGGPLFTGSPEEFRGVDHLVLNEAEVTLPFFLEDLSRGCAKHIYGSTQWADITRSPLPLWELLRMKQYASLSIQYSRGCPFNCEFCDITVLCGRVPRTKEPQQIIRELERLHALRWRGAVFFVDDNFIGNKGKLKKLVLPAIIGWMERKGRPFSFITQASIELSDDEELMQLMVKAGFDTVFVGIETPNEMSLAECSKVQNKNRDLLASVRTIHRAGLMVHGGFIVGFDNDPPSIFEAQISFIQKSGIVTAMVGLLNALPRTQLYKRLEKEQRLLNNTSGDNTDFSINFVPKMNYELLISGYRRIISTVYSPEGYYRRVKTFLENYVQPRQKSFQLRFNHFCALLRASMILGIIGKERFHYWKLVLWTLFRRPRLFPLTVTCAIYGFHFRKIFEKYLREA